MRRFSQRNSLVTLNEINVTPLLDIAFVLLIIFIITAPLLEQGLPLQLPVAEGQEAEVERSDVQVVELHPQAIVKDYYRLNGKYMLLEDMATQLSALQRENPNMIVYIRADGDSAYKYVARVLDRLHRGGISQYSLRTDPTTTP